MSLKSALKLAKSEIKLLCDVATEKLRDAGQPVDPPSKTYKHILRRIDDEAHR